MTDDEDHRLRLWRKRQDEIYREEKLDLIMACVLVLVVILGTVLTVLVTGHARP